MCIKIKAICIAAIVPYSCTHSLHCLATFCTCSMCYILNVLFATIASCLKIEWHKQPKKFFVCCTNTWIIKLDSDSFVVFLPMPALFLGLLCCPVLLCLPGENKVEDWIKGVTEAQMAGGERGVNREQHKAIHHCLLFFPIFFISSVIAFKIFQRNFAVQAIQLRLIDCSH